MPYPAGNLPSELWTFIFLSFVTEFTTNFKVLGPCLTICKRLHVSPSPLEPCPRLVIWQLTRHIYFSDLRKTLFRTVVPRRMIQLQGFFQ
jgi:hypothetical protein